MTNKRRERDIITIKRTIWSNYDKFRYFDIFCLEKNAVLAEILTHSDEEIAKIAAECREGGVRWRGYQKYLNKIESALISGREVIDMAQSEEHAFDGTAIDPADFLRVRELDDGVAVSFNIADTFDVLQKGNRNGCFELRAVNVTPATEFTLVNELNPFWEDRYSLALKSPALSFAITVEDPKTGKKGSSCAKLYVLTEDKLIADDLGKYMDTSALTLWVNP